MSEDVVAEMATGAEREEPMLEHFRWEHLPAGPVRDTSIRYCNLAILTVRTLPRTPERTVALRKLLEGKDAAVRCAVVVARAQADLVVGKERAAVDSPELKQRSALRRQVEIAIARGRAVSAILADHQITQAQYEVILEGME